MIITKQYLGDLIRRILREKIRDFKNVGSINIDQKKISHFSIDELKKVLDDDVRQTKDAHHFAQKIPTHYSPVRAKAMKCYFYCKQRLQPLGSGSSRSAFVLTNRFVIKVAIPHGKTEAGLAQNEHEVLVSNTSPTLQKCIPNVKAYDPDFYWIITEIVRPLVTYTTDYKDYLGLSYSDLRKVLREVEMSRKTGLKNPDNSISTIVTEIEPNAPHKAIEFIENMILFADQNGAPLQEMANQLGTTSDGRVVIYDYGLSEDIYASHYGSAFRF